MLNPANWNFWYVWAIGIPIWLAIGWAEFGYFESRALEDPTDRHITLSYAVWYLSNKFPLSIFWGGLMLGLFIGTLSTHFYWHFCPQGSVTGG